LGNGTNTSSNSPGSITCPTIVLPITWLSIDAYLKNNTSVIRWSTAQEVNSYKFEIEYSADGVSFNKIGVQDAAGFSSTITNYSFTHNNPALGVNYYRIKQFDQNGQFSYSSVVKINNKGGGAHIILSPNPAQYTYY
jgi:hypothetical protein